MTIKIAPKIIQESVMPNFTIICLSWLDSYKRTYSYTHILCCVFSVYAH